MFLPELWDGLLETRIRLQKILPLSNRLPQSSVLPAFREAGKQALEDALAASECMKIEISASDNRRYTVVIVVSDRADLRKLLNELLELQRCILLQNTTTQAVLGGRQSEVAEEEEEEEERDEVVASEENEEERYVQSEEEDEGDIPSKKTIRSSSVMRRRLKRKRRKRRREWSSFVMEEDYEDYVSRTHESLRAYQHETIDKWNKKLRLASEKTTSKVRCEDQFCFTVPLLSILTLTLHPHSSPLFSLPTLPSFSHLFRWTGQY